MPSAARRLVRDLASRPGVARRLTLARAGRGEDGFLLIEVMVSVLLVGLIAVATFNGFAVASRFSADQRRHSEAALLAAQSQEQLRSDPATALDALESAPHSYTKTVNGTEFTITQEAKAVSSSGSATGCTFSETSKEHGANVLVTSAVTWALLVKAKRPAVKQASVITPPIGSALEVDVSDGGAPPEPVSGVTAVASFVPEGSVASNTAQGTTGGGGCVVLSGLASTSAEVEILKKPNFITTGSLLQYPTKEVTIVPNLTTQYPVTYAEGARLEAEFTYKGSNKFGAVPVTGDTFGVENSSVPSGTTPFATGGTAFEYEPGGEELYKVVPGTYSTKAFTAAGSQYLKGDLFPFPSGWTGYAGDCPNNAINAEAESPAPGIVLNPGETKTIKIPLSYTLLNAYSGVQGTGKGSLTTQPYPATITDTECEGAVTPLHASEANLEHTQVLSSTGHLSAPFQPFGKQTLCVVANNRTFTVFPNNATVTGSTKNIYIGELSNSENAAAREAEEKASATKRIKEEAESLSVRKGEEEASKAKRVKEETEVSAAREKEEETARKAAITKEAGETATKKAAEEAEDKKWQKEESTGKFVLPEKKFNKAERETKEKTFKTKRETEEKTTKTNRESAETTARLAKEKTEETNNKVKQTAENTANTTKLNNEKTANTAKQTAEKAANTTKQNEEKTKNGEKEVVVGSLGSTC
jgi:Tfp pilus assembly protein PilV